VGALGRPRRLPERGRRSSPLAPWAWVTCSSRVAGHTGGQPDPLGKRTSSVKPPRLPHRLLPSQIVRIAYYLACALGYRVAMKVSSDPVPHGGSFPTIGALLRLAWLAFRNRMYSRVRAAGYNDLSPAHVLLFRYPTVAGLRPSQLADSLGLSRQSVNDLLRHLEAKGYLVLQPDPSDGRARRIALTERGAALLTCVYQAAQEVAEEWALALGRERVEELRQMLLLLTEDPQRAAPRGAAEGVAQAASSQPVRGKRRAASRPTATVCTTPRAGARRSVARGPSAPG